jgi:hypothetical protein
MHPVPTARHAVAAVTAPIANTVDVGIVAPVIVLPISAVASMRTSTYAIRARITRDALRGVGADQLTRMEDK